MLLQLGNRSFHVFTDRELSAFFAEGQVNKLELKVHLPLCPVRIS